jgi:hypothetical protein
VHTALILAYLVGAWKIIRKKSNSCGI